MGVERSRTAIHNRMQKADLQPSSDAEPDHVAVDETVIQISNERHWLCAAVDPTTNELLHTRRFQTLTTHLTVLFLRELREQLQVEHTTFLVDGATHLASALDRLGLDFKYEKHGNRNSVGYIFRAIKRRTLTSSNTFAHASLSSAESRLQASPFDGIDAEVNTGPALSVHRNRWTSPRRTLLRRKRPKGRTSTNSSRTV